MKLKAFITATCWLAVMVAFGLGPAIAESPDPASGKCAQFAVSLVSRASSASTPSLGTDSRAMPVVLVHGWNEGPQIFDDPTNLFADGGDGGAPVDVSTSLAGRLQAIPGVAVYAFDYSQTANRWVTDGSIGPRLAMAIKCLTDQYGRKAVVVAHSMGGLAARYAVAQTDPAGEPTSSRVALVATFGTPNTGSLLAAVEGVAGKAADADARASGYQDLPADAAMATWLFLQTCGREYTAGAGHVTRLCQQVWSPLAASDSDAARALRTGSSELAALPPWPPGLPLIAVAGSIKLAGISLFGSRRSDVFTDGGPALSIGDVVVGKSSAVSGATRSIEDQCSIQAFGRSGSLQLVRDGDIMSGGLTSIMGLPCFHNNLLRTLNGVNPVIGSIRGLVGNASAKESPVDLTLTAPNNEVTSPFPVVGGQTVEVTATGSISYGYEGTAGCVGNPVTDPDGNRSVNGIACGLKFDTLAPLPTAPIGALIARVGTTGPWKIVGSKGSFTAATSGSLYFAYNDSYLPDDSGAYTIQLRLLG